MLIENIFFTIAAFLWTIALIPQLVKTYKSKRADDICLIWLYLNSSAYICFISGYMFANEIFMFYVYLIPTLIVVILTILVYKYRKQ